jgi:hypothetical protein
MGKCLRLRQGDTRCVGEHALGIAAINIGGAALTAGAHNDNDQSVSPAT